MKSIASDIAFNVCVDIFNRMNATADKVKKVSETLFLHPYVTKTENHIFDALFYTHFLKFFKRNLSKLDSLPPTCASAGQRLFRVYHQTHQWLRSKQEQWDGYFKTAIYILFELHYLLLLTK